MPLPDFLKMPKKETTNAKTKKEVFMADRVLFIGWNRALPGREKQAMELFQKGVAFWNKLQADGRIERYESVTLAAHGGDLNGFFLLYGSAEKLAQVREDKNFLNLILEVGLAVNGLGIIPGYTGEGLTNLFSQMSKFIGS
jgi:hypothetical protein